MQHLYRLNEYYEVNLYKGTYYKETEKLDIGPLQRNEVPIRVFPLQDNNNGDKNWLSMGMLATKNNPNDIKVNIRDVFETIPDNVTEEDFILSDDNVSQEQRQLLVKFLTDNNKNNNGKISKQNTFSF